MGQSKLEVILSGKDQGAVAEVKELTGALKQVTQATEKQNAAANESSSALKRVSGAYTDFNSQIEIVKTGFQMLSDGYELLVGDTMQYAGTVRQLSLITGASAEDTSRLIQMTDDFGLELGSLEQAARGAAQKGVALTTESLARMADEYNGLSDPVAKNTYLLDNFGKSGLEMAKVLSQGSQAIRDGSAAVADNMVLTQQQVDQARNLEIQLDNLNDSWTGIKNTIGNAVIPVLAEAAKTGNLLLNWASNMDAALKEHQTDVANTATSYEAYTKEMERSLAVAGLQVRQTEEGLKVYQNQGGRIVDLSNKYKILSQAQFDALHSGAPEEIRRTGDQADGAALAVDKLKQAWDGVGVTYQDLNPILRANIDLTTQQREDFNGIAEATAKIDEATKNYEQTLKDWQGGVGSQLAGMLDENKLKTDKYKDALGIIDKTMGTNLKTESDQKDALKDLADKYNTGKITGDEFGKKLVEIRDQFAPLNDKIAEAKTKLDELYAQIDKFSDLSINVNVNYSENGGSTGGSMGYTGQAGDQNGNVSTERALGGPVGAGTYIVGENGPEVLQLNPGSSGNVINHYNATYNVNAHYPMQRPGSVRDDIIALTMRHNIGASRWMA